MWLLISFDLPTQTPEQRKSYRLFRKNALLDNGLVQLHESLYYRWCYTRDRATVLQERIRKQIPAEGKVTLICLPESIGSKILCIRDNSPEKTFEPPPPMTCC